VSERNGRRVEEGKMVIRQMDMVIWPFMPFLITCNVWTCFVA
jgi:hypothetical protein